MKIFEMKSIQICLDFWYIKSFYIGFNFIGSLNKNRKRFSSR